MLESYKINVIAIWENYAIKSQLLINILADIKGYMGNIKSGVFACYCKIYFIWDIR